MSWQTTRFGSKKPPVPSRRWPYASGSSRALLPATWRVFPGPEFKFNVEPEHLQSYLTASGRGRGWARRVVTRTWALRDRGTKRTASRA